MGETKTLPLVARYADACNLFDIPDGGKTVTRKLAVLARQCEKLGRAYASWVQSCARVRSPVEA